MENTSIWRKKVAPGVYQNRRGFYIRPVIKGNRTWRKLSATSLDAALEEMAEFSQLRRRAKLGLGEPLECATVFMPRSLLEEAKQKSSESGWANFSGYLCHLVRMDIATNRPTEHPNGDLPSETPSILRSIADLIEQQQKRQE